MIVEGLSQSAELSGQTSSSLDDKQRADHMAVRYLYAAINK